MRISTLEEVFNEIGRQEDAADRAKEAVAEKKHALKTTTTTTNSIRKRGPTT